MRYLSEAQRLKSNSEFSKRFSIVYDVPLSFPNEFNNFDGLQKLLVVNALQTGITLTKSYEIAGIHPEQGIRAKNKLVADGMAREHSIVTKGSGGHCTILELLPPAIEILKKMNISPVEMKGRGSFLHRFYTNKYLAEWAKSKEYKYWIERWLEPKCIDFVYEDEYQRLNAIEVSLSGDALMILESGKKCASLKGIHEVTLAFNKRDLMKLVKELLKKELMSVQEKIFLKYLNEYWIDDERKKETTG